EQKIPFFGICLGMQCSVVEVARNLCGWQEAHSTEFDEASDKPVIDLMAEQREIEDKGGTMRLGSYECTLSEESHAFRAYGKTDITERHRHRYEFNNEFKADLEKVGLRATGVNPSRNLVEIVEFQDHPWFVGVQFHPELKSTVSKPHPLFVDFVSASLAYSTSKEGRVDGDQKHAPTKDASLKASISS
ncbi:MAG TPA: hypothetical protein DC011_03190, partial [Bacteroidetes bacterium]|nr:hypothetical protein [Bacteroidota bacterium]